MHKIVAPIKKVAHRITQAVDPRLQVKVAPQFEQQVHSLLARRDQQVQLAIEAGKSVPQDIQDKILDMHAFELADSIRAGQVSSEQALVTYASRAAVIGSRLNLLADFNFE